ncbi:UbiA family prenyltransferase [Flavihumibacter profundi]|jgi:1,4-dihydroxy-2-naphthoate polyprenyltransferase|uniref:UbiA family prenyltransferase n=1 Tax=Flavihumibacter profundi TaxID=2716883 RepID=UPI001CC72F48|nr:UbiA family prenyltransferase [Flavihumibacter profundi]MBZ5858201.1 UbiA family prenyltransferase [Flavihumibacter profundi]
MLKKSTIQLLRFPFAFFLLPVYLFALSQVLYTNWWKAALVFFILHLLVYPASNGYNSFIDRDESPVGGIRHPMQPTRQLLWVVLVMDIAALILSLLVSSWFTFGILLYILASRAYSSRVTRLKKYPVLGFLLVVLCQGGLVFWLVYHGVHQRQPVIVPLTGIIASTLLIAGAYPLTQVYQHAADQKDGVRTISMLLGVKGTFRLSALLFNMAFVVLGLHFALQLELVRFFVLLICFFPVLIYFLRWAKKVWQNTEAASFDNLMGMNKLAAICSNTGFLILLIWKLFD